MKNKFLGLTFYILFLFANNRVQCQEQDLNLTTSKEFYAEKIYLQLSSTVFTTDKTIWFKAIVTDLNHTPTKLSGILHVELIDFDERVIDQKLLKLEKGIADSFFQLNEAMSSGRYLIRAYTKWNTNFDADFISEYYINLYTPKTILENEEAIRGIILTENESKQYELSAKVFPRVIDPKYRGKLMLYIDMDTKEDSVEIKKDKQGDYRFNYLLPEAVVKAKLELRLDAIKLKNNNYGFVNTYSKTFFIDKDYLDLQFFPEGGKLVDGVLSTVAFKALDYKNEGQKVSGNIVDQYDSVIAPFVSNKLGMGITYFKADVDKIYYGSVKNNRDVEYKFMLPKVVPIGQVLTVRQAGNYIRIGINSNDLKQDSIYLKVQSRGVTFHNSKLQLKNGIVNIALEKKSLPEGIVKLTILNTNKEPVCERLIYNFSEDYRLNITATPHLKQYSQRDKTIINIFTKDKDSQLVKAHLSVLILNKEQLGRMQDRRQNILSYFLLNSELRGNIESPYIYFDKANKNRHRDMDALMLTQGWRHYKYENSEITTNFKIEPEKTLVVSGTVGEFFNPNNKKKQPLDLTLMTFGKPQSVFKQQVDSTGYFNFYLDDMYADDLEILIQSKNYKGKQKDYTINIDKTLPPNINYKKKESIQLVDSINNYLKENIERKHVEEDFKVSSGTIALDEVKLSGYKLTTEREKMMNLHGPPDIVIEDKELHKEIKKWSYGLFSVLLFSYPEDISIRRVGRNGGFLLAEAHGADFTFIIIDGIPVKIENYGLIGSLPTEEIKSVEIIKSPKNPRKYVNEVFGDPRALDGALTISFISIYTYSKKGLFGVQRTSGIFKGTISGLTPQREFYAPKYEDLQHDDWNIPDLRSVVYWNPNIITDIEGKAQIDFYNADNTGDMLVVVEGITENGHIGYYNMSYTVDEKIEK
ncbi:hypothetical protein QLS71_006495 [Mariniflexile litorale]|uniref:TonB-dependent receptor-like protein n=1 Tax=Mariniflexile litorale TaxID=3045158 RepID=A0AAU7EJH9_9FLAO|nr:hypothetical protein [Mariniflexile sp. KMM 9835]MDQ8211402.1 hypothetical protein [Mariniflexile sp. KMM 9835]